MTPVSRGIEPCYGSTTYPSIPCLCLLQGLHCTKVNFYSLTWTKWLYSLCWIKNVAGWTQHCMLTSIITYLSIKILPKDLTIEKVLIVSKQRPLWMVFEKSFDSFKIANKPRRVVVKNVRNQIQMTSIPYLRLKCKESIKFLLFVE